MKDDEARLLRAVRREARGDRHVRDVLAEMPDIPSKRAWYLLSKWTTNGWYSFGVTLDLGWLTEVGEREAARYADTYKELR